MKAVIVDYGSGNLRSAAKALERAAPKGVSVEVSADAAALDQASHIVLPGVGAFADCKRGLEARPGMLDALERAVRREGKPFLGICVGMQLMAARGREFGVTPGLGWIAGEVRLLEPGNDRHGMPLKVPHMGWNELQLLRPHPVFDGLVTGSHAYFVHSYHLAAEDPADLLATCDYGGPVTAAVARANMVGTQFHPEKSQALGLKLLANFLAWKP
ncbi:imidazole glycerol phosphate synthase subunit HisH [Hypericibacter sp.]|uniref:imidazole glycerol phosphate synthase subunit HisH n=1 Tax=Hypericibacter sp. TaxID=2705401 RepID=UPI003D6D569C